MEPRARHAPFPLDRPRRDVEGVGRFLQRQPAEVPKLDDAAFSRVERREPDEELVERQDVEIDSGSRQRAIREGHSQPLTRALVHVPAARMVHENTPHHL